MSLFVYQNWHSTEPGITDLIFESLIPFCKKLNVSIDNGKNYISDIDMLTFIARVIETLLAKE